MPDPVARTRVDVVRPAAGGRSAVHFSTDAPAESPVLRPVLLHSDHAGATVSLVPEGALLLSGDAIAVDVTVGAGAQLRLLEPAGTVAYSMDGGRASWDVSITLGPAASLTWAGEPFVVAAGAEVDRRTTVRLGFGAACALRETVVLGRQGEQPGVLRQQLDVTGPGGAPILHERLEVGPTSSALLLGGARAMGSVLLLGHRLPSGPPGSSGTSRFDLEYEGTLVRSLADQAHRLTALDYWAQAICSCTSNSSPVAAAR